MSWLMAIGGKVLDLVLPPRCAACGTIVADLHSFCPDCWLKVDFLGNSARSPIQRQHDDLCLKALKSINCLSDHT